MMTFSGLWHIIASAAFIIVVAIQAPTHQDSHFAWFDWTPNSEYTGITSPVYIVLVR